MSYDWMEETITMPDGRLVVAKVFGRNRRDDFEMLDDDPLEARWVGSDELTAEELFTPMVADGSSVLVRNYLLYRTLDHGVLYLHEPDEDDVL